jgi:hypothetical protein
MHVKTPKAHLILDHLDTYLVLGYGEITPELVQIICERVEKMGEHGGSAVQSSGA